MTISTGTITTIAGSSTSGGYSGDNSQATSAKLYHPWGIALDSQGLALFHFFSSYNFILILYDFLFYYLGNVYIADANNHRIRKVTVSTGIITTFAGTGTTSYSGDNGPATSAVLYYPTGVALDTSGNSSYILNI